MDSAQYEHRGAVAALSAPSVESVRQVIASTEITKRERSTPKVRARILDGLHRDGWPDETKLDPKSGMTITGVRDGVGLCFQTGNMGRMYADLLKLQLLFARKKITGSIILVYSNASARELGQNLANFDRLTRELEIFTEVITVPTLVFGLEVIA